MLAKQLTEALVLEGDMTYKMGDYQLNLSQ